MATVMFYHLTASSAAQTLATILPRALALGWRVLLRAPQAQLAALDTALWQAPPPAVFLPHGMASGGEMDQDQPILLADQHPSTGFDALALVGGAGLDLTEAAGLQRVWVLFDAADQPQVEAARALWRQVAAAGLHAQYWQQEGGAWAQKTAVNAPVAG
jgi:DNA polymerase III subunit chi